MELKDYIGALQDFNRAISIDPYDSWAYRARALLKYDMGDIWGAYEDDLKCIDLFPDSTLKQKLMWILDKYKGKIF